VKCKMTTKHDEKEPDNHHTCTDEKSLKRPLEKILGKEGKPSTEEIQPSKKACANPVEKDAPMPKNDDVVDVCKAINLPDGSRIEVKWLLEINEGGDNETEESKKSPPKLENRWWGATLLSHDGRLHILKDEEENTDNNIEKDVCSTALRVLEYDSYEEMGFKEKSKAEVIFLSDHSLLEICSNTYLDFRRFGSTWEVQDGTNPETKESKADHALCLPAVGGMEGRSESMRSLLDTILQTALTSSGIDQKMKTLDASKQFWMANKIKKAKDVLFEKMMQECERKNSDGTSQTDVLITADAVKRCMQEMAQDLRTL